MTGLKTSHTRMKERPEIEALALTHIQAALEAFKQSKEWEAKLVELQVCTCMHVCCACIVDVSVYLSLHSTYVHMPLLFLKE